MGKRKLAGIIIGVVLALILIMVAIVMIKTVKYPFRENVSADEVGVSVTLSELSLRRFSGGIRIPTISNAVYEETDFGPFDRFKEYLPEAYPAVYAAMDTMTINNYGLVFRWRGRDSGRMPILLLSHYDVVPVVGYDPQDDNTGEEIFNMNDTPSGRIESVQREWDHLPFSGAVAGGRIYGRGTLDMKGMLFSIMEAADALIAEGFQPEQDIWFAFGHDEEVGGVHGAIEIAKYFQQQGLRFDAVYDEGGVIAGGVIPGVEKPVAVVGLGEKGFATIRIRVRGIGGHSSMPPAKGSLVMAAEIIEKLNSDQFPAHFIKPISSFFDNIGGEMGFATRMALANQWLFKPVLVKKLSKTPATNALIRTTTAVTMARGSDAANVLSSVSEITANFRILPGETVQDVIDHVERICEGYDTAIDALSVREPSAISPDDVRGFRIIEQTVDELYPGTIVSSYITIGGTDAYKYQAVSDNIYRFMPVSLNAFEQGVIHNENEHITFDNFARMIEYFKRIMKNYQAE